MQKILIALCIVGIILLVVWLLKYSGYGIDFTDESFYLVWIANPFIYNGSISQFGFVYHPVYKLLGGDVSALRQVNIILTFVLAWCLVYSFLVSLAVNLKQSRIALLVVSASLATSVFIFFDSWLATPSYNSLNLQALLISSTGLVLAEKKTDCKSISGWLLIGIGGWLAFMAKPSTALALAFGVFIYLFSARKISIRMLFLAASTAFLLLLFSALLIDGSVLSFINRLRLGVDFGKILAGGHTLSQIIRIDNFQLSERLNLSILLITGVVFLTLWSMYAMNKKWQVIGVLTSIIFFSITALLTLGYVHRAAGLGQFQGLLIFAIIYAVLIAALTLGRLRALRSVSLQHWMIGAVFLGMPHVYAFGTNSNYWQVGSCVAIFWLLAGLTILSPLLRGRDSWLLLIPLSLAVQAVSATLIQTGLEQPYRQPQSLRFNVSNLEIGHHGSALMLSEDYSTYIATAMAAAKKAGFEPNTPLIDLTGQSPGILYAIGAENIGQAWTIGGYPGSLRLAQAALAQTSCEKISTAWVLFEKDGPRGIPKELMHSLGADFPNNFKHVGTWPTAEGAGGYPDRRTQDLYRPLEQNKAMMNCQKLRKDAEQ